MSAGSVFNADHRLRPWAVTANFKFYILTHRIQPWVGLGIGAFTGT